MITITMMDMKMWVIEAKYKNEQSNVNECILMNCLTYLNQHLRKVGLPGVHHSHHHDGGDGGKCQNEFFNLNGVFYCI